MIEKRTIKSLNGKTEGGEVQKKESSDLSVFQQEISETIWKENYQWQNETIQGTWRRQAKKLASLEKNPEEWEEKIYSILENFQCMMGGRIQANIGTSLSGTSLINCFISGKEQYDNDSIEGIYDELKRQALTLKSEGGYGYNFDHLRPKGSFINGIGSSSPGVVAFMRIWDVSASVITEGAKSRKEHKTAKKKARKGAQMFVLSVWHPEVLDFVKAKKGSNKLTKANLSVGITDKFMEAVRNNEEWQTVYPDTTHPQYKKEWHGNLEDWISKGYDVEIYDTYNARDLWNTIAEHTYNYNEPGVLFIDRINSLNNLHKQEFINASNPCGEQVMYKGNYCLLAPINLVHYTNTTKGVFNLEKLEEVIPTMVRAMDNVHDLTYLPLEMYKEEGYKKRRIGMGITGYGSALYMLKLAYGSKKALEKTEELASFICNKAYQASAMLAKEKGAYEVFDLDEFLTSNFVKQALWPETIELVKKYGIRNSHLLSIAPTGTTSFLANMVSNGLEPVFLHNYIRTKAIKDVPNGLDVPENIDFASKTFEGSKDWCWIKEGKDNLLKTTFNGDIYKIDANRGLTIEVLVEDYAVRNMGEEFYKDKERMGEDFYGKTTNDLNIDEHMETMKIWATYMDAAISKTINIPNDYPFDDFKNVYSKAYDSGVIKGITTYRAGTMASVLKSVDEKHEVDRPTKIEEHQSPKRPKVLPCKVFESQVNGEKWQFVVGTLDGHPYEIFAGKYTCKIPENGVIEKVKSKTYILKCEGKEDIELVSIFGKKDAYKYSKMLQFGVPMGVIVEMTSKMDEQITGFNRAIGRIIKKFIKQKDLQFMKCDSCGSKKILFVEGCITCQDCGTSKCS
jgi:ribonucleoside-diphosphate reductase alpha chain